MDSQPPKTASANTAAPPRALRQRIRRLIKRLLVVGAITYMLVLVLLIVFQTQITFPGSCIPAAQAVFELPSNCTRVTLQTRSGIPLAALFLPAFERNATPVTRPADYPTILYFYGNGQVLAYSFYEVDLFRRCGANVLVADYPGFGLSGRGDGAPSDKACYETADALYDHAIFSPDVDPQRIVAVGWSLGGAMAIHVAEQHQVAGLMTLSAFTSLDDVASHRFWFVPTSLLLWNHFPNEQKIRTVTCPTVVGHGDQDPLVPYHMHQGLMRASGASDVTHLRIAGAGHNDMFATGYHDIAKALRVLLAKAGHPVAAATQPMGNRQ